MSDVTHVTHVTSTQTDASNTINAEGTVIAGLPSAKEKDANKVLLQMNKLTYFIKCSMN
jgi:hypothetical protein